MWCLSSTPSILSILVCGPTRFGVSCVEAIFSRIKICAIRATAKIHAVKSTDQQQNDDREKEKERKGRKDVQNKSNHLKFPPIKCKLCKLICRYWRRLKMGDTHTHTVVWIYTYKKGTLWCCVCVCVLVYSARCREWQCLMAFSFPTHIKPGKAKRQFNLAYSNRYTTYIHVLYHAQTHTHSICTWKSNFKWHNFSFKWYFLH